MDFSPIDDNKQQTKTNKQNGNIKKTDKISCGKTKENLVMRKFSVDAFQNRCAC